MCIRDSYRIIDNYIRSGDKAHDEGNLIKASVSYTHLDELIINVVKGELDIVKKLLKEEMENTIKLSVPLDVDVNVGEDWYKLK